MAIVAAADGPPEMAHAPVGCTYHEVQNPYSRKQPSGSLWRPGAIQVRPHNDDAPRRPSLPSDYQRVDFKVAVITYRCRYGTTPGYLTEMFTPVTDAPGRRHLRSAARGDITVKR